LHSRRALACHLVPTENIAAQQVHVDEEQMRWFEAVLAANADTPVVVFTHAPPMGSGLKAGFLTATPCMVDAAH